MRAVWIYRHAESLANAGEKTLEVASIPLSAKGRAQALALTETISETPDRIVVSPFLRTAQTAEPVAARFESADTVVWPIQEFTYLDPVLCVGTSWVERKPMIDAYWARLDPHYIDGAGAESFATLMDRARAFLADLTRVEHALTLVVSHGQFMQTALLLAEAPSMSAPDAMALFRDRQAKAPFANCERLRLAVTDAGVRVDGRG